MGPQIVSYGEEGLWDPPPFLVGPPACCMYRYLADEPCICTYLSSHPNQIASLLKKRKWVWPKFSTLK